jgi:YggT family protein
MIDALVYAVVNIVHMVITLYIWVVIIAALLSFVQPDPGNPIVQTLYRLTEPVYRWLRSKMPFLIMGGIDLSPLVLIIGLQFIDLFLMKLIFG